jgi:hypothetical protein
MKREIKINKVYRHFKGSRALVLTLCKNSETMEDMVVYACFDSNNSNHKDGIYVRPLDMFLSEVDHEKYPDVKQKYRFEEEGGE